MRKSILLVALVAILLLSTVSAAKAGGGNVEYTWTLAALGQGGWIGGPLYADGSAGGGGAYSDDNGEVVARLRAVSWTEDAQGNISVCISTTFIKGFDEDLPAFFCTPPSPVTDTAIKIMLFGEPHIFRISETGQAD
jgi:hypothetical protein